MNNLKNTVLRNGLRKQNAIANQGEIMTKLKVALCALALSFSVAKPTLADDIEIYTGITEGGSGNNTEYAPNLLFLLDTSGSMAFLEAIEQDESLYVPSHSYGAKGDDLYLYSESGAYMGVTIPPSQNFCKDSIDVFDAENSKNYSYRGKVLLWEHWPAELAPEPSGDCAGETRTIDDQRQNKNKYTYETEFRNVDPNRSYTFEIEVDSDSEYDAVFGAYFYDASENRYLTPVTGAKNKKSDVEKDEVGELAITGCSAELTAGGKLSCRITSMPAATDRIRWFARRTNGGGGKKTPYTASLTLDADTTSNECKSDPILAKGDWTNEPVNRVDKPNTKARIAGLECEADFNRHGRTDSEDGLVFPYYQGTDTDDPSSPKYGDSDFNANAVNWGSSEIKTRYLYTENYHDFLQLNQQDALAIYNNPNNSAAALPNLIDLGSESAEEYCTPYSVNGTNEELVDPRDPKETVKVYRFNSKKDGDLVIDENKRIYKCTSRMETLKKVMGDLLKDESGELGSVNIGLGRFNNNVGGTILAPVKPIEHVTTLPDDDTDDSNNPTVSYRKTLLDQVDKLVANGATPMQESLYAAYSYYAGKQMIDTTAYKNIYYADDQEARYSYIPKTYSVNDEISLTGVQDPDKAGYYKSPIQNACQDNNIILLSDGDSSSDNGYVSEINNLTGSGEPCTKTYFRDYSDKGGACLDDLAGYMANNDVFQPGTGDSGVNKVFTYTVNFGSSVAGGTQLIDTAKAGQRSPNTKQSFEATTARELTNAFQSILKSIKVVSSDAFVSPAVAVNAFNRLQFRNELYFAIFEPESSLPRWNGNVKKFRVNSDGQIIGRDGLPAVDVTGFFSADAKSEWPSPNLESNEGDGGKVRQGGAAAQLTADPARKLYANLWAAGGDEAAGADVTEVLVVPLTEDNFVSTLNDDYGITYFGESPDPDGETNKQNIAKFTLGKDVLEEVDNNPEGPNYYLGESLHSTPFVIDFGDEDENEDVLFVTTNQGLLHAIDGVTGKELWAYLPDRSLAKNLGVYFNNISSPNHQYGLDGAMTFDVQRNAEGKVTTADIFVGQRRGGNKYFAIDVHKAKNDQNETPVAKKWTIEGLPRMAQTWAKPVLAKVNYCESANSCGARDVVFLMGGYDADNYDTTIEIDGKTVPQRLSVLEDNVKGNAIYMVDRATGQLLWMAGKNADQVDTSVGYYVNSEMVHGFPTEPTVIDTDFDGIADMLYAIDVAGRVWRFDFVGNVTREDESSPLVFDGNDIHAGDNNASSEVAGGIIAELNGANDERRFYNKLDVSISPRTDADLARFNLVTGSGLRPRPLLTEEDSNKLFFVFDRNIARPKVHLNTNGGIEGNGISYNYADNGQRVQSSDIPDRYMTAGDAGDQVTQTGAATNTTQAIAPLDTTGVNKHGFYILLDASSSEKMINPTLTNDNFVLAVSYSPADVIADISNNVCQKTAGTSVLYQINLTTGAAARIALQKSGISAPPVVIEVENDDPDGPATKKILIIGSESFDASGDPEFTNSDGSDIDKLGSPGLGASSTGEIKKVNWWERRRR